MMMLRWKKLFLFDKLTLSGVEEKSDKREWWIYLQISIPTSKNNRACSWGMFTWGWDDPFTFPTTRFQCVSSNLSNILWAQLNDLASSWNWHITKIWLKWTSQKTWLRPQHELATIQERAKRTPRCYVIFQINKERSRVVRVWDVTIVWFLLI